MVERDGGCAARGTSAGHSALIRQMEQDDIAPRTRINAGPPLFSKIKEACDDVNYQRPVATTHCALRRGRRPLRALKPPKHRAHRARRSSAVLED